MVSTSQADLMQRRGPDRSLRPLPPINADVGEDPARLVDGRESTLLALVQWANIACGGHAGDDDTMRRTLALCAQHGVMVGAHPSYPDPAHFGRQRLPISSSALAGSLHAQMERLRHHTVAAGLALQHLKPHGALYHAAGDDNDTAEVLIACCKAFSLPVVLYHRAPLLSRYQAANVVVIPEAFCDRGVGPDGALIPRGKPGAVLTPSQAVAQATHLAEQAPEVRTLCIHSDSPGAEAVAQALRR